MYIYIGTQSKCTKRWKQSSAIKQLLESDAAHIVFIHITSVGKSVHIFMTRNRAEFLKAV